MKVKRKNLFISLLLIMMMAFFSLAVVSCKDDEQDSGNDNSSSSVEEVDYGEAGTYYVETQDGEYQLILNENAFTLTMGADVKSGTYTYDGQNLVLNFAGSDTATATIADNVLSMTLNGNAYRFYKRVSFTVTYNTDGGNEIEPTPVWNGQTVAQPPQPVKEGYNFIGWYADATFDTDYAFNAPVTGNITLYARFVEDIVPDVVYTVTYMVDGEVYATGETLDGVVYNNRLPAAPTKDGATFAGWWVSNYYDATKLTYQYDEQTLKEDTTFYAVWVGDVPTVSVTPTGVAWAAKGVSNRYTVTIMDENDEIVGGYTGADTSYSFNFENKDPGNYTVTVTVGDYTATAYYKNKALARAKDFSVDEASKTLSFVGVENAEKYLLTIDCGNPEHNHESAIDLGTNTSYDFGDCGMQIGGIQFAVQAMANGYMTSQSEVFAFSKDLLAATGLGVEATSDTFVWDRVENAAAYTLEIISGGVTNTVPVGVATSYDLSAYYGELTLKVYASAQGYNGSVAEYSYTKTRLATPTELTVVGTQVSWKGVTDATKYIVKIDEKTYEVTGTSMELTMEHGVTGSCAISVQAIANDQANNSFYCGVVNVNFSGLQGDMVKYNAGYVTWDPVVSAVSYAVKVNDGEEVSVQAGTTSYAVTLTKAGANKVSVSFYDANEVQSEWINIEVEAYGITFDTRGGKEVATQYKAAGDPVELPNAEYTGYDFKGWFNVPENGTQIENGAFENKSDVVYYAYWTPSEYIITLELNNEGTVEEYEISVFYKQAYELPVAISNDAAKMFKGWFHSVGGTGELYTNVDGTSKDVWNFAENRTLYVGWTEVLTFTLSTNGEEYSVSANQEGIKELGLTEITLPENYNGKPVATVEAFQNCSTLEKISIPHTVENIAIGLTGSGISSAFYGCSNLKALELYCPNEEECSKHEPIYSSAENGSLIKTQFNGTELAFIPAGLDEVSSEFEIPYGVTTLPQYIFSGTTFTKITVPATVTDIQKQAFSEGEEKYNTKSIAEIEFLPALEGEEERPLTISNLAFEDLTKMTSITLPKRMSSIASDVFDGCTKLTDVFVSGIGYGADQVVTYSDAGGVLCRHTEATNVNLEIVFCPKAKTGTYVVPASVTAIGSQAFMNCTGLTHLTVPAHVKSIGNQAFKGCTGLGSGAYIGDGILFVGGTSAALSIGDEAFYGCTSLRKVTLPSNLVSLGKSAFGGIIYLTEVIVEIVESEMEQTFSNNAFASTNGTSYIERLYLGANAPEMEINGVFGAALAYIEVAPNNKHYSSLDGVLFNYEQTAILCYPNGRAESEYTVPDTVLEIGGSVFKKKDNLVSIKIGTGVTSIGEEAFADSKKLQFIEFLASEKKIAIDNLAFKGCSALKNITITSRITSLGDNVFQYCTGLESITIEEGVTSIGKGAFASCQSLKTLSLPASLTAFGGYTAGTSSVQTMFDYCYVLTDITVAEGNTAYTSIDGVLYGLKDGVVTDLYFAPQMNDGKTVAAVEGVSEERTGVIEIPETVARVWDKAFYLNTGIEEITFPNGTVSLAFGSQVFESAKTLAIVELPEGVASIPSKMFYECRALEKVVIPSTVTTINPQAFHNCKSLTAVVFNPYVGEGTAPDLTIEKGAEGTGAFNGCDSLLEINLPERTTQIGQYAFYGLSNLQSVTIPEGVTKIDNYAFANSGVKGEYDEEAETWTLSIPRSVTTLGQYAFTYTSVTAVSMYASMAKIDNSAFSNCTKLASLNIIELTEPTETEGVDKIVSKLTTIGQYAFSSTAISEITIPATVTMIDTYAFAYCENLKTATISPKVATINTSAFLGCTWLETVDFQKAEDGTRALTKIGDTAFKNCVMLEDVVLPETIQSIGKQAFSYCTSLTDLTFDLNADNQSALKSIYTEAFSYSGLTSFTLPETAANYAYSTSTSASTAGLRGSLFKGCMSLTEVHIPTTVTDVGDMFKDCSSIQTVTVPDESKYYEIKTVFGASVFMDKVPSAEDETVIKNETILLVIGQLQPENGILDISDISEDVIYIGEYAFEYQDGFHTLILPATLQKIGRYAFTYCMGLKTVTYDKEAAETALTEIETYGFGYNSNLETVEFPDSLETLGTYMFYKGTSLTSVDLGDGLKTIGNQAFNSCDVLEIIEFPASITSYGESLLACDNLKTVILPYTCTELSKNMFSSTIALKTIKVRLEDGTLKGADGEVTLPEKLTDLGSSTFMNSGIEKITIPAGVTKLYATGSGSVGMFYQCYNLHTVNFAENSLIDEISTQAFYKCTALTEFTIPSTVTKIGDGAFQGSGLTEIVIPAAVTKWTTSTSASAVPNSTFASCASLEKVTFESNCTTIVQSMFSGCKVLKTVKFGDTADNVVTIGASVTSIGHSAFLNCDAITSVVIQDGIDATKLTVGGSQAGNGVFANCDGIETVQLPNMPLGKYMFSKCTKLHTVTMSDEITAFDKGVFSGCSALDTVYTKTAATETEASKLNGEENKITLPSQLTNIGTYTFENTPIVSVTIPAGVLTFETTSGLFNGCESLSEVIFLGAIKDIGGSMFANCTSLSTIDLPASVEYIYSSAFSGSGISSITFGDDKETPEVESKLTQLYTSAFADCLSLKTIDLPNSVTSLGEKVFSGSGLTSITIPTGVKKLNTQTTALGKASMFLNCKDLTTVTLHDDITSFGVSVFEGCSSLENVVLPKGLTLLGNNSFKNCTSLETVEIGEGLSTLGTTVFTGCTSLQGFRVSGDNTKFASDEKGLLYSVANSGAKTLMCCPMNVSGTVVLGDNVSVGASAFDGCANVTSVVLSGGTKIASKAFQNATGLMEIEIPEGVTLIDTYAFQNCAALRRVILPTTLTSIGNYAFSNCESLQEILLPAALKTLGTYAFENTGLLAINIPGSVTSIGTYAFQNSEALESVTINEGTTTIGSTAFKNTGLTRVDLPSTLTTVGTYAFENCKSLTTVTMYDSVTKIDGYSFRYCTELTDVTLSNKLTTLGAEVFAGCTSLKEITLPGTLTSSSAINQKVFLNCTSLTDVTISEGITALGQYMFSGCTSLTSITLPQTLTTINNWAFQNTGLTTLTIPAGVTTLGTYLFQNSKSLTSVDIQANLKTIPQYMFQGCTSLTEFTIPESVTKIDGHAFEGTGLISIVIPDRVMGFNSTVGASLFQDCTSLVSVTLPKMITEIPSSMFKGCTALTTVEIPENVTKINSSAFQNSGLTSLELPSKISELGQYAFAGCTKMTYIVIPETVQGAKTDVFNGWTADQTIYMEFTEETFPSNASGGGWVESWYTRSNATVVWGSTGPVVETPEEQPAA